MYEAYEGEVWNIESYNNNLCGARIVSSAFFKMLKQIYAQQSNAACYVLINVAEVEVLAAQH